MLQMMKNFLSYSFSVCYSHIYILHRLNGDVAVDAVIMLISTNFHIYHLIRLWKHHTLYTFLYLFSHFFFSVFFFVICLIHFNFTQFLRLLSKIIQFFFFWRFYGSTPATINHHSNNAHTHTQNVMEQKTIIIQLINTGKMFDNFHSFFFIFIGFANCSKIRTKRRWCGKYE